MQSCGQLLFETVYQFFRFRKDVIGVGTSHLLDGYTRGRVAVQRTVGRVSIRAKLYPGNVFQFYYRTVSVGFDDDILIIFVLVQLTLILQYIFVYFFAALTKTAGSCFKALV